MAKLLWGKVYYQNTFAGILRQEPGFGSSFTYDPAYLQQNNPAIAYCLPLQAEPYEYQTELPPFFDNLVAEGWLEQVQSRLLGKRIVSRFELLLAFGQDCAGAVSVIDSNPEPISDALIKIDDPKEIAIMSSRASLSGIQPKLALVEKQGKFYAAKTNQLSTYIAKLASDHHADLIANEYLTTLAFKHLLPDDSVAELNIGKVEGLEKDALIIKRFDRSNDKRVNFEEFNQLFDQPANNKYFGSYKMMADFMYSAPGCLPTEVYRLYLRILAGILLGNTDMHLKNFAMLHINNGLHLTPAYDQVAALLYGYEQLALSIDNKENINIYKLQPTDIITLGHEFDLNNTTIMTAIHMLRKNIKTAQLAVLNAKFGSATLKQNIVNIIEKIWNKTFASIGPNSLPKR